MSARIEVIHPATGDKQSGFGRDLGAHALDPYTQVKSVWVALA